MVGAGFAVVGAILALVLISGKDSREHAEAAQRGEVEAVPVAACAQSLAATPPTTPRRRRAAAAAAAATGALPAPPGSALR